MDKPQKYKSLFGNKNAEKYNIRKAIELFNIAIQLSEKKNESNEYEFDFIGEIAGELGTFHAIFKHLISRFPTLKKKHNILLSNLERNCYFNTKKGNINTAVGIINLKSNHKWTDRIEQNENIKAEIETTNKPFIEFYKTKTDENK